MTREIDLDDVIEELASVTSDETTGIAVIVTSGDTIHVRTWGDQIHEDVRYVAAELSSEEDIDDHQIMQAH